MKLHRQKGVAAVELAFIVIPMLIMCFGITELGRALSYYDGLVKATRGAVRYLAQQDLANMSPDELTATRNKAVALAVCGLEACPDPDTTPPLVPGLTAQKVSLCDYLSCASTHNNVPTGQGTVDLVSVAIGGTGTSAFNFTSLMAWVVPDITFSPMKTTMTSRYF